MRQREMHRKEAGASQGNKKQFHASTLNQGRDAQDNEDIRTKSPKENRNETS